MEKRPRSKPNYNEMYIDSDSDSDFGTSSKKPDSKLSLKRKLGVKERAELAQLQRALELSKQEALQRGLIEPEEDRIAGPSESAEKFQPVTVKDDVITDSESEHEGEGQEKNVPTVQESTVQDPGGDHQTCSEVVAAAGAAGKQATSLVDEDCELVLDGPDPSSATVDDAATKASPDNVTREGAETGGREGKTKRKGCTVVLDDSSSGSGDDDWHENVDDFNAEDEDHMSEDDGEEDYEEEETPKKKKKRPQKAAKAKPAKESTKAKKAAAPKGESKSTKKATATTKSGFTTPKYPAALTPVVMLPIQPRAVPSAALSRPPDHRVTAPAPMHAAAPVHLAAPASAAPHAMATSSTAKRTPAASASAYITASPSPAPQPAQRCAPRVSLGSTAAGAGTGNLGGGSSSINTNVNGRSISAAGGIDGGTNGASTGRPVGIAAGNNACSTPTPKLASGSLMCRLLTQSAPRVGLSRRYRPPPLHPQLHTSL